VESTVSTDASNPGRPPADESSRIERIWGGEFGNDYVARNRVNPELRQDFWRAITSRYPAPEMLEVGCNVGANVRPLSIVSPHVKLAGIDINAAALAELHGEAPSVRTCRASAAALPFADRSFDMVFTVGVLIHQPPELLPFVMAEIVRCTRRFVLCAEYFAEHTVEVPYRGQTRALFKDDFGRLYVERHGLRLLERTLLTGPGWDEVTCWVLTREPGSE
jgi:pseudaminic acid biosynthesis-associated methylase